MQVTLFFIGLAVVGIGMTMLDTGTRHPALASMLMAIGLFLCSFYILNYNL